MEKNKYKFVLFFFCFVFLCQETFGVQSLLYYEDILLPFFSKYYIPCPCKICQAFCPPYYRDLSMNKGEKFLRRWWDSPYSKGIFALEVILLGTAKNT